MKARRIASLRFLALLLALLALSSSLASVSVSAQQGGFAAAAGAASSNIRVAGCGSRKGCSGNNVNC